MRAVLEKNSVLGNRSPEPGQKCATSFARTEQTPGRPDFPSFPHHWLIPAHKPVNYTLCCREKSLSGAT